jgi:hypothetical protein
VEIFQVPLSGALFAAARAELSIPSVSTDNYQLRNSQFNSLLQLPTANYLVAISSQIISADLGSLLYSLKADPAANTAFNNFYILM